MSKPRAYQRTIRTPLSDDELTGDSQPRNYTQEEIIVAMPSQPQLLQEELSEDTGHKTLSSGEADRLERWDQVEKSRAGRRGTARFVCRRAIQGTLTADTAAGQSQFD